jgi:tetratricopeptide (TPR) repeat protein
MYNVMAGEMQGHAGDFEQAAADYVAAALESPDPAIAKRATQVAIAAESWAFAAMAADRWVQLDPASLDARQTAIRVMLLDGNYVAAEHQMSGLLDVMRSSQAKAWSIIATELAAARDPERAEDILSFLIEGHSAAGNADALFAQSQLAARTGRLDEAAELAALALEAEPNRADLQAWSGRLAVNLGALDTAMERYRRAHQLKPADRTIATAYAELLKREGRVDEALAVLADIPDTPGVRFGRIGFALASDRREDAEAIYRGFFDAAYADDLEAAFQAARSAELLGFNDEAIDWYARVNSGERALVAVLRRSVLLANSGELEAARNLLARTRMHRDATIQLETYLAESQILSEAGEQQASWEILGAGLEALPGNIELLYGRALLGVELGYIEEAERDLRQILDDDPQNAAALNALGYTLADRSERLDEAEQLIRAAHELQPEEPSILDSMGWVAYRQGRLSEALAYLEEAWARDNNPEIAAHLGEVLWQLGRKGEAREIWREGFERGSRDPVLRETLDRFGVEL